MADQRVGEIVAMVSSFLISWRASRCGKRASSAFAHTVLYSVAFTTICWVLAAYVGAPTNRERLIAFYRKVHPAGPGWRKIRLEAGVTEAEAAEHGDHMAGRRWGGLPAAS